MTKAKILVIEDEKDLVKLLSYNLQKEGYETSAAFDGRQGLEMANSFRPDLIILDLMLPEIDGNEVCRILKYSAATKHIPILMLTAKTSPVDQVVGLELGAADYLTKPFNIKVLLARIKNVLSHQKRVPSAETVLHAGDFKIDRDRLVFECKDQKINLTRIEFKILAAFVEKPGSVLTRERIASLVWGDRAVVSPVAINMHIRKLRKKLGKYRGRIETVRGSGYRLAENAAG